MKKWTVLNVTLLIVAIIGVVSIAISFFQEGNKMFLIIGLLCSGVSSMALSFINFKRNK